MAPALSSMKPAAGDLLSLARSRDAADQQRLLRGVAAMCEASPPQPGDPSHALLSEIFLVLAAGAERDIRRTLSECLAGADWAPPALIHTLAIDEIEIARPVIAASPLLKDQELLKILVECTIEHQIEVARRPRISGRVADAIIEGGEPAVMTALAANRTAEVSEAAVRRLVEASQRIAALRAPLVRHPAMNDQLAQQLYGWVGQALREALQERFRVDAPALSGAIDEAVRAAYARKGEAGPAPLDEDPARDEMERRLVAKMDASGQLRPGYLIRAIREGRLSLFEHALATLGGFPLAQVRDAVRADHPEALRLACAAVGIDRAVFPAMLDEVRKLSGGLPTGELRKPRFMERTGESAARAFRAYRAA
ncbi:DUF2336 domain-containing protein [Brevundimonas sp.]|uniref:DUF2336 domain-containing protein n=1 Tax=Brevundimonas sp. TaxID=1871086 RepID=UPI003919083C